MKPSRIAVPVIAVAIVAGFLLASQPRLIEKPELQSWTPGDMNPGQAENETVDSPNSSFEYGSAHEHALFYVVVNGTPLDFTADRYELNSRYVHLEADQSRIVHKHAKGVTWSYFLDTINASVSRGEELCFTRFDERYCGNGTVAFKGPEDLGSEIQQGDKLVIVIGGDVNSTVSEYLEKELPESFRPQTPGRRV
ncbi:MAG: hypothetical protein ABEJ07_01105 [Candidatus Nanohaloarchaea archaeon]